MTAPEEGDRGFWTVSSTMIEDQSARSPGFTRKVITFGGRPDKRVRNKVAAELHADLAGRERTETIVNDLCAKGQPMTVLVSGPSGTVNAIEGRGYVGPDGTRSLIAKGSRTKGYAISNLNIIDVARGYGEVDSLAATYQRRAAQFVPPVEPITRDDLATLPVDEGRPRRIAAAYLIESHDFGNGPTPGCLFLATDVQLNDGPNDEHIINGYFWAPGDSDSTSETSSFYWVTCRGAAGRSPGSSRARWT